MSGTEPDGALVFGRAAPTILVTELERALAFYVGALGLERTFVNGTPPRFAIVKRDVCELHLSVAAHHVATETPVAHVLVSDATALHGRLVLAGARIVKPLRDAPYGLRDFIVADPDGNRIDCGEQRG